MQCEFLSTILTAFIIVIDILWDIFQLSDIPAKYPLPKVEIILPERTPTLTCS